ncbi:MAG: hypothetical protein UU51_C0012G0006 [Microgenomates group bacterium GW2011_GWC1_41_20]|uniref:Uncharacterized protein n=3 Tax=Candidatus Woeseibacteriota TaxID=1752722 RepID=A0A0G0RTY1_9BACT|nr:MAG: hypothetical protein UT93_C0008G0008 [Candidatus Woesebacteria bacterium GW2011_GWF1_40_24]KKR91080.1 MAG: hypothetical protein UU39_C0001G0026 [Candidatus Woesebacteria bacterium GW2011_GWD1_41_12]KKS00307.1 MAG: hypothetical protein UU51_C0012G0006 [Microgenomates group bacterium GW2011_GWC1_41_20]KKS05368.1 MAG: hypothetical protein UU57_C0008G0007 [Candidatus Woesebacteria bacterium GW2011_GWE1_41_24]
MEVVNNMKKNSLPKPITILILTLLTALVWVGLNIYRSIAIKPAAPVSEDILKPLNPTLDMETIQKIEAAIFIQDSEVPPISVGGTMNTTPIPSQTPLPTVAPESSPSASPAP